MAKDCGNCSRNKKNDSGSRNHKRNITVKDLPRMDIPNKDISKPSPVMPIPTLETSGSLTDELLLTGAVRDIQDKLQSTFLFDIKTNYPAIWDNNPYVFKNPTKSLGVYKIIPDITNSDFRHRATSYASSFNKLVRHKIEPSSLRGEIYLSKEEIDAVSFAKTAPFAQNFISEKYWIISTGDVGYQWEIDRYQKVVDYFREKITFVQVGKMGIKLNGVVDVIGKTNLRQLINVMYHANGVLCHPSFLSHLAAAVPVKEGDKCPRACVVIGGGKYSQIYEHVPGQCFLSSVGLLYCCETGGCWKSECVNKTEKGIPKCLDMIRFDDIIREIEKFVRIYQPALY